MVGVVVSQGAETMVRQVVGERHGVHRGLAVSGGNNDDGGIRWKRWAQMILGDHNRLAARIVTFAREGDNRCLLRGAVRLA